MTKRLYRPVPAANIAHKGILRASILAALTAAILFVFILLPSPMVPDAYAADAASPGQSTAVSRPDGEEVYIIGEPAGVRLFSDGVIVAGTADVITDNGAVSPAAGAGLREGDVILRVDGRKIRSSDELLETVEASQGKTQVFTVRRGDTVRRISVTPVYSSADNRYRIGVWINDGVSGIGVISFVEPDTLVFCAVGHPLGDDSGIAALRAGVLEDVRLTGIRKGTRGIPGELIGYLGGRRLGNIGENCDLGVFGHITDRNALSDYSGELYSIAPSSEVREGPAKLYIRLPGSEHPELYDIVIEKIERGETSVTRNLTVKVTDKRLLEQTGGIVQGMSGTPVIQDGKFAAAVTHVFVSDPTRGYAVFAEMLTEYCKKHNVSS